MAQTTGVGDKTLEKILDCIYETPGVGVTEIEWNRLKSIYLYISEWLRETRPEIKGLQKLPVSHCERVRLTY
jgi:hypothetical protein